MVFTLKIANGTSVYLEKVKVTDCIHFTEALQVAFAIYFNMNLKYPKAISTTLEMIQRYFLKIHPDSGTKSQKISSSKIYRLLCYGHVFVY
ncbi:hypothetical protein RN001_002900 [Aquatica leii]|uniref:Uncharacterized protein n=1 Tax=Aquatica leii TaxID=1421715 RepID=A0AAN7PHI7_9COLE|nr:hypothetical protein RN001_002900 [Aquatica leii]